MLTIKKRSFKSNYQEECIQIIEFNEEINSIKKLLDFLGYEIPHTAVKIGRDEIHICKNNNGELNRDYDVSSGNEIELYLLPDSYDFYKPTLSCLMDCEIHSLSDVNEYNVNYFNFPEIVLNKKTCGDKPTHYQRSVMAVDNLRNYGNLVEKVGNNQYKITNKGLRFYETHDGKITQNQVSDYNFLELYSDLDSNKIFFGAPGTGKSYKLNEKVVEVIGENNFNLYERVTFHPEYSYSNFVGAYKPVSKEKNGEYIIDYKFVPGPFLRILKKAIYSKNSPSPEPYFLIIEEINRANFASVFGEVFQLLDRNNNGESEYFIDTSEEMRKYLLDTEGMFIEDGELKVEFDDFRKIKIPNNMFIWATMNSADQGVFYMDTAFKRRWDFEYLKINAGKNKVSRIKIKDEGICWNDIREAINEGLLSLGVNEDKLLGPFFAFSEYIPDEESNEDIEIKKNDFDKIFKDKIIMYLFEDAARPYRKKIFYGAKDENKKYLTYSDVCDKFDAIRFDIFCPEISRKINGE